MAEIFESLSFWQLPFSGLGTVLLSFLGSIFTFSLSLGLFMFFMRKL